MGADDDRSRRADGRRSPWVRALRGILWALVIAFAIGFLIGSLLRRELERPVRYLGSNVSGNAELVNEPRLAGH